MKILKLQFPIAAFFMSPGLAMKFIYEAIIRNYRIKAALLVSRF